jgi:hypothetical protein
MIAGYSAIFLMLAVYLISLVVRWRKMKRDLHMLEGIQDESGDSNKPK